MDYPVKTQTNNSVNSLARIRSRYPTLATSETKVADWVLQHATEVMHMSMAQVAHACGVSDTTVLRFCRNAGFQGYLDLKLSIARDIASPTQIIHDDISADDEPFTIARKVFTSNIQALYDTLEVLDENAVLSAVKILNNARKILIIGVGTSAPIVQSMYNMFVRLGFNCSAQTDSYLQLMEVALVGADDVVVAVSQSGSSIDPVLTLQKAKQNGARTICITGNAQSPITQHADITLLSVARETRAESLASRIAQSTIIDALYVIISLQNMETAIRNEKLIWDAWIPKTL